jgi:hypothetical protein
MKISELPDKVIDYVNEVLVDHEIKDKTKIVQIVNNVIEKLEVYYDL